MYDVMGGLGGRDCTVQYNNSNIPCNVLCNKLLANPGVWEGGRKGRLVGLGWGQ